MTLLTVCGLLGKAWGFSKSLNLVESFKSTRQQSPLPSRGCGIEGPWKGLNFFDLCYQVIVNIQFLLHTTMQK